MTTDQNDDEGGQQMSDTQLREALPPMRTFRVQRYKAGSSLNPPVEELTLFAHAIQFTETGVLMFVQFDVVEGAVRTHFNRIIRDYIEVEEIREIAPRPSSRVILH